MKILRKMFNNVKSMNPPLFMLIH